jgi:hypothetical protein
MHKCDEEPATAIGIRRVGRIGVVANRFQVIMQ